jgi:hypothetical protein
MPLSLDRIRLVAATGSAPAAGTPAKQPIIATTALQKVDDEWQCGPMTSSSPDRVDPVLTTGGEKDVEQLQDREIWARNG